MTTVGQTFGELLLQHDRQRDAQFAAELRQQLVDDHQPEVMLGERNATALYLANNRWSQGGSLTDALQETSDDITRRYQ